MSKREGVDFVPSGNERQPSDTSSLKKSCMYDLRTGKPFEIPENDQYGRCRAVTDFEKLNRIGEGTYGIVYRAKDTKTGNCLVEYFYWPCYLSCLCNIIPKLIG